MRIVAPFLPQRLKSLTYHSIGTPRENRIDGFAILLRIADRHSAAVSVLCRKLTSRGIRQILRGSRNERQQQVSLLAKGGHIQVSTPLCWVLKRIHQTPARLH